MITIEIKLILLSYKELDYIPELGGYWVQPNIILPSIKQINKLFNKYNIKKIYHSNNNETNKIKFYMNLLNFNNYSDWTNKNINNIPYHVIIIDEFAFGPFDGLLDIYRIFPR